MLECCHYMIIRRMKVSSVFYLPSVLATTILLCLSLIVLSAYWLGLVRLDASGGEGSKAQSQEHAVLIDPTLLIGVFAGGKPETQAVNPDVLSRYRLCGYASNSVRVGGALISIDGAAPKLVRIGREFDRLGTLVSLEGRSALFVSGREHQSVESRVPFVRCG